MPRKRHTAEQVIGKLREAEVSLSGGPNGACGLQDLGCFGTDVLPLAQGVRRPKDRAGTALQGARAGESAAEMSCR